MHAAPFTFPLHASLWTPQTLNPALKPPSPLPPLRTALCCVMHTGGPTILPLAAAHGVRILPADSEHSAIFQVMQGLPEGGLRR